MAEENCYVRFVDACCHMPIFNAKTRSLKRTLMSVTTGGRLGRTKRDDVIVEALTNISFELHPGDKLGVIGHNGAGKTTLLRMIAGVYEPTSGLAKMRGRIAGLYDLVIGMDFEASGYDNIHIRGLFLGLSKAEIDARVEEIAEFTELGDYLHLPLRVYSSGMLMRLAFAISTCVEPDITLMDEWVAVGDRDFQAKAEARLQAMLNTSRILVVASHSPEFLRRICNKMIWLDHGTMRRFGDAGEIVDEYLATLKQQQEQETAGGEIRDIPRILQRQVAG